MSERMVWRTSCCLTRQILQELDKMLKRDAVMWVLIPLVIVSVWLDPWLKPVVPQTSALAELLTRTTVPFESGILLVLL